MTSVGATVSPRRYRAACPPSVGRCRGCCCLPSPPPGRRGATTPLRLRRLRPQALLGLSSLRESLLHRMVWWPDAIHHAAQGCLPGPPGAQIKEARASTGLPGPAGWWPLLGSRDGRLGLGRIGRLWTRGAGGSTYVSRGGHLRPYMPQRLARPGPGPCGCFWVRGTAISLSSCRSFDRLG